MAVATEVNRMADEWLERMRDEIAAKEVELKNLKRAANTFYLARQLEAPFPEVGR